MLSQVRSICVFIVLAFLLCYQCETNPDLINPYSLNTWERFTVSTGLTSNLIASLKCDSRGDIWVGTLGAGIMKYDGNTWTFLDSANHGIDDDVIYSIEEDANGEMWFGTRAGFSILDGTFFTNYTHQSGALQIMDIHRDSHDNMWLATGSKGLFKLESPDQPFDIYHLLSEPSTDTVHCIEEDETGTIWAGTEGGVLKITGSDMEFLPPGNGIPEHPVTSILSDSWGDIWFGSRGGKHVVRLSGNSFKSISLYNGREGNFVLDMLEAPGGDIWFGMGMAGVIRFNGGHMVNYREDDGLAGISIFCMEVDHKGQIWFGSFKNGLSLYRPGLHDIIPSTE